MLGLSEMSWRHIVLFALVLAWVIFARAHGTPPSVVVAGGVLVMLGEALRIWATGHIRKNKVLTLGGPYRYVRDPMYIGSLLIGTGFTLAGRQFALLLIFWLIYFVYYIPRKRRIECERLLRLFGDAYANYMAAVRSLIPRLTPYRGAEQSKFSWRQSVDNHEPGIILILVTAAAVLCVKSVWLRAEIPLPAWLSPWF